MIRYVYNTQVHPPAPFVLVTLRDAATGVEARDVPAQLDTGADRSVIPLSAVQALTLPVVGGVKVAGLGGAAIPTPLYGVELCVHGQAWQDLQVIAHPGEPWVLLGRDVLNVYRLLLDGSGLALEVG